MDFDQMARDGQHYFQKNNRVCTVKNERWKSNCAVLVYLDVQRRGYLFSAGARS
jgi:hypothetical protein